MRLKRNALISAGKVETCHVKTDPRADAGFAFLSLSPGWLTGLELEPQAVGERVAVGFPHVDQNIFLGIRALRVLHGGIHLTEDSQVIEPGLRNQHILLAERLVRVQSNFALHYVTAG